LPQSAKWSSGLSFKQDILAGSSPVCGTKFRGEKEMDLQKLEDAITNLSLLDVSELVQKLEKRLGVSADVAAPIVMNQTTEAPKIEEKTEFSVILKNVGAMKINVIKAVREVTQLGLKEARDMVDGVPKSIKEGISKAEAEAIAKKFTDAGATVEVI
jgi:large subunit ribosomal protein L7/L12